MGLLLVDAYIMTTRPMRTVNLILLVTQVR